MDQEQLTSINRIIMYVWLAMGVVGLIATVIAYTKSGTEGISTVLLLTLISFMMYGWKRFQISKFSSRGKN